MLSTIISIAITLLVFSTAVALKGGWIGGILTNWDRFTKKFEVEMTWHIEAIRQCWRDKQYGLLAKFCGRFVGVAFGKWFFDGSIMSLFLVMWYVGFTIGDAATTALFTAGWFTIMMSMGEEAGAAGDHKGPWGDYIEAVDATGKQLFSRTYGIKKGIQYGAFAGGIMALALGSWCPWIAGALFPLVYFGGSSLRMAATGKRGWSWAEPLWGLVFGIAYECARHGFLAT